MDMNVKKAITDFFTSVEKLKDLGVIRSDKYLGDLGEYISKHFYAIELAQSGRQEGYDGTDAGGLVQVKYHGSSTRTNIDLGNPSEYDNLLVVLGPNSFLRDPGNAGDFLIYRMPSAQVRNYRQGSSSTYSCGKVAFSRAPDNVLNLNI
ncbi:hypothetical protein [Plesiomonas shigelloides]|uniref:hypothetical protein n=1 Tax=Plesiomonas shigelloides TaxID=703 RepID=UPI001E4FD200|nr:hypothetical protein [Plesiomonas shigelloides]